MISTRLEMSVWTNFLDGEIYTKLLVLVAIRCWRAGPSIQFHLVH